MAKSLHCNGEEKAIVVFIAFEWCDNVLVIQLSLNDKFWYNITLQILRYSTSYCPITSIFNIPMMHTHSKLQLKHTENNRLHLTSPRWIGNRDIASVRLSLVTGCSERRERDRVVTHRTPPFLLLYDLSRRANMRTCGCWVDAADLCRRMKINSTGKRHFSQPSERWEASANLPSRGHSGGSTPDGWHRHGKTRFACAFSWEERESGRDTCIRTPGLRF